MMDYFILSITSLVAFIIFILGFIIPLMGLKKFGGTKYRMYGGSIGILFLGIFIPIPFFGIILGVFLGAYFVELISKNKKALIDTLGSAIDILVSSVRKLTLVLAYLGLSMMIIWEHKSDIF